MTVPPASAPAPTTCPACGAPASGRFCANCGASLAGASCAHCQAPLTPGARFCHRCGTPAGATAAKPVAAPGGDSRGFASAFPWAVAALALVSLIALVVGQRFGAREMGRGTDGQPIGQPGVDGALPGAVRAPDISQMSPQERADRLFDRVMSYAEQGKTDSAQFFAPMALQSYAMLDSMTLDQHYDVGRIAEVTGDLALARAEADTILAKRPTHLLGLILAANVARRAGNERAARDYTARLVAAAPAEQKSGLGEYLLHKADVDSALARAMRRPTP